MLCPVDAEISNNTTAQWTQSIAAPWHDWTTCIYRTALPIYYAAVKNSPDSNARNIFYHFRLGNVRRSCIFIGRTSATKRTNSLLSDRRRWSKHNAVMSGSNVGRKTFGALRAAWRSVGKLNSFNQVRLNQCNRFSYATGRDWVCSWQGGVKACKEDALLFSVTVSRWSCVRIKTDRLCSLGI